MNKNKRLFVKFCALNEYTFKNLKKKQLKFSTVYQLNDLNEYSLNNSFTTLWPTPPELQFPSPKLLDETWKDAIVSTAKWVQNIQSAEPEFIQKILIHRNYLLQKKDNFYDFCTQLTEDNYSLCEFLKNTSNNSESNSESVYDFLRILYEVSIWRKIRILCLASIDIFSEGSAHLMFSHYAANYAGVALIYEYVGIENDLKQINYKKTLDKPAVAIQNGQKIDSVLKDVKKQLFQKPDIWAYEREHRMVLDDQGISTVLLKNEDKIGLKLIGLFYTGAIKDSDLAELKKINVDLYYEKLEICALEPCGHLRPQFFQMPDSGEETEIKKYLRGCLMAIVDREKLKPSQAST